MVRTVTLLFLVIVQSMSAVADTYPEVLFENSLLAGNYAHSRVEYQTGSWVENISGHLPVSDSVFFTPGNALSLKYTSGANSTWTVQILYPEGSDRYRPRGGDVLTFKMFVASPTEASALPRIKVMQVDHMGAAVDIGQYVTDFQSNMWLNVRVPLKDIEGLDSEKPVVGLELAQGGSNQETNWLYLDQIEFLPANPPRVKLSSPAVLSTAVAFDRHVELTWQLPLTPSIRYIKIYRSEDNEHFDPVAIRPIFVQKCTDFVPYSDRTYYYKIAWVDYSYLESPFSNVLEASPKKADDEKLLDFVQAAHVNYFVERTEINSGMHAIHFGEDDAAVSVKETGLSLLASVVGVERGILPRPLVISRLKRIVDFLSRVERYHGVFPAVVDGRTAKGIFAVDTVPTGDLKATAYLMQGLLVAKQYFQADSAEAAPLIERIDSLWNTVEWNRFTLEGQEYVLLDRWSPTAGFKGASPLGGVGEDLMCYVLALASSNHALPPNAYSDGLGSRRELADSAHVMELANNTSFSVKLEAENESALPKYVEIPYQNDTLLYSLPIRVGSIDTSLMEAYKPFLAFDPRAKRDTFADYMVNNVNLSQAYKRRDNEQGYGGPFRDIWGSEMKAGATDTLMVLNPAIAAASYAFLPTDAVLSIRSFYDHFGPALFTEYGFRKGVDWKRNAIAEGYDAENQAAVAVMIENGRSGLIWDLFARNPEIQKVIGTYFTTE